MSVRAEHPASSGVAAEQPVGPAGASDRLQSRSADRARERLRRLTLGSATALVSKGIHVAAMLVTVPMTLSYLGPERYGLWMTITSLVMLLGFADFGLGNGLLNAVATAAGRGDVSGARRAVSTGAILLVSVAGVLGLAFAAAHPLIPWAEVLNTSTVERTREGTHAAVVLVLCVLAGVPLAITQRVQAGHQEVHVSNLWQGAGSVVTLLAVTLAVASKASLPVLVASAAGTPVLVSAAAGWYEFTRRRSALRPSRSAFSAKDARTLLRSGGFFVILQLAAMVLASADNVIVAQVLGPAEVTTLAVPARLFGVIPLLVGLAVGPLWPAYAAAKAQGDVAWVRKAMARSMLVAGALAALVGGVLVLSGQLVLRAWVGDEIAVSTNLLAALAVWTTLSAVGSAQSIALNGMGVLRVQAVGAVIAATLAVAGKVTLASRFGLEGVVWASVPIYACAVLIPGMISARHHLSRRSTANTIAVDTIPGVGVRG